LGEHLEFALKYDGINLGILECLFHHVPEQEIADWITSKPTGKYARKIWFLIEFITGKELPLDNLTQGNYVDPRFRDKTYRSNQNYVGQVISYQKKIAHYIYPKPDDLHELMDGLLSAHRFMIGGGVPAVIHAAVIAYDFVFMHPFEDGNGRIHRFLIHNILPLPGAVPKGLRLTKSFFE